MRKFYCIALLSYISLISFSQEIKTIERTQLPDSLSKDSTLYKLNNSVSYLYTRPKFLSYFKNSWKNFLALPVEADKKSNIPGMAAVVALTAISLYYDEKIIIGSQKFGKYAGLLDNDPDINVSPIKNVPLLLPGSFNAALFYVGDGTTELAVDASFYFFGLIKSDNRALRTSCELSEGILITGIYVQILKHITCRETPSRRSIQGGKWRFFASLEEYGSSVPTHDAYPSGHLATAMMTVTVISMNYPEYKFIKPLGYTLMAICGYQMLDYGVHWMSDYPLAIAMGYVIGKNAVNKGRTKVIDSRNNALLRQHKIKPVFNLQPVYLGYGTTGLSMSLTF
jgi:hypothetical protein